MARTNIHFNDKQQELLNSIWEIFLKYGYEKTTIAVIMRELSISRGAFYHYFKSKEECADMAIKTHISRAAEILQKGNNIDEKPCFRLKNAIRNAASFFWHELKETAFFEKPENALFHQKFMVAMTKQLAPLFTVIIEAGIKDGEFNTPFPLEMSEMVITLSSFYLDNKLFGWEAGEQRIVRVKALESLINRSIGTSRYIPFFDFYFELQQNKEE